jgi:hypothetical protein
MKSIFFSAALFFAGSTMMFAQDTTSTPSQDTTKTSNNMVLAMSIDQDEKTVSAADLPAAVRTTLASDAYAGWKVETATKVSAKDKVYYKVTITDGTDKKTVKLRENGEVKAKDKDKA